MNQVWDPKRTPKGVQKLSKNCSNNYSQKAPEKHPDMTPICSRARGLPPPRVRSPPSPLWMWLWLWWVWEPPPSTLWEWVWLWLGSCGFLVLLNPPGSPWLRKHAHRTSFFTMKIHGFHTAFDKAPLGSLWLLFAAPGFLAPPMERSSNGAAHPERPRAPQSAPKRPKALERTLGEW